MTEDELLTSLGEYPDNQIYLPKLAEQMRRGAGVVPFVGAGLSFDYGFPLWGKFIRDLARFASAESEIEAYLAAFRYEEPAEILQRRLGSRFQDLMEYSFGDHVLKDATFQGAAALVPRITIGPVITTNFDRLLENVFANCGCHFPVVIWHDKVEAMTPFIAENSLCLLKLHGDWQFPQERVLTLSEYQKQYGLSADEIDFSLPIPQFFEFLVPRPMLFLGCSLQQDRTGIVFAKLAARHKALRHYAILEYPGESARNHRISELEGMNICPIWFPPKQFQMIEMILAYLGNLVPEQMRLVKAINIKRLDTIPNPETGFVGREEEKKELRSKIINFRLVTVVGAPGTGKTRLAEEVARSLESDFDAIWFVALSQLASPSEIPQRIVNVMQVKPGEDTLETVVGALKQGRQLLILDNCETAMPECASIIRRLRKDCPMLRLLLTSRIVLGDSLGTGTERLYHMPLMETPDPKHLPDLAELVQFDSIKLFADRAQAQTDDFRLTKVNAEKAAQLCHRLEGIPLAIELAAAQMDILSVDSVLTNLKHYLDFEQVVEADSQELQVRTLRKTIQSSYELLKKQPNGLRLMSIFVQLSVFQHGWMSEAALTVCGECGETEADILNLLRVLRRASLIEVGELAGEKRYRYLDSIREFASEMANAEEQQTLRRRHAQWAAGFAERWSPELLGEQQATALERMIAELDNLSAALDWAVKGNIPEIALRITSALWLMMEIKGLYREGRELLSKALKLPGTEKLAVLRSKALSGLSRLAFCQGDLETSERCSQESLRLEHEFGTDAGRAIALNDLGNVAAGRGEHQKALDIFSEALRLHRKTGNDRGIAVALYNCGYSALLLGLFEQASDNLHESLKMFQNAGNQREAAFALDSLAELEQQQGHDQDALRYADNSLEIRQSLEDRDGMADTLRTKAGVLIGRADTTGVRDLLKRSKDIVSEIGDDRGLVGTLECLAWLNSVEGSLTNSVVLYSAAEELAREKHQTMRSLDQTVKDKCLRHARETLDPGTYSAAWEKGRHMPAKEAFSMGFTDTPEEIAVQVTS
jgi:predicted ATPase